MTNLKLRNRTYYCRLPVPRALWAVVGKRELLRTLRTDSLSEANRRKFKALAELQVLIDRAAVEVTLSPDSADYVTDAARLARQSVDTGVQSEEQAAASLDASLDRHLDRMARRYGVDADGHPLMSVAHERTLRLAMRVFKGDQPETIGATIARYLGELKGHITNAGYNTKQRHLGALTKHLGADAELATVGRKVAAQFVSTKILPTAWAAKTKVDAIASLGAFGSWCERVGLIEASPFRNLTRLVRESSRGGVGRPKPRPFTPEEYARLLQGLPAGTLRDMALIGAYSGLRIEELSAMKVEHLTPGSFHVTTAKNENSVRAVPVHPLIAPLVERLTKSSTDGYLIVGLRRGGADSRRSYYASRRFSVALRQLEFTTQLNFHGLRRSFAQRLEVAAVPEHTTKQLLGHARQSLSYGLYSPGVETPQLVAAMTLVSYGPEVDAQVTTITGGTD